MDLSKDFFEKNFVSFLMNLFHTFAAHCITKGEIIKNLKKGEFYKYLGIKSIKSYSTLKNKRKFI
jgi:hypothetical protein